MLVAGIHVRLLLTQHKLILKFALNKFSNPNKFTHCSDLSDAIKMMNIHMNKHSEKPTDNLLAIRMEVLRKRSASRTRKQGFVIYLLFDPFHEQCYVLLSC